MIQEKPEVPATSESPWSENARLRLEVAALRDCNRQAEAKLARAVVEISEWQQRSISIQKQEEAVEERLARAVSLLRRAATDLSPAMDAWDEECDAFLVEPAPPAVKP